MPDENKTPAPEVTVGLPSGLNSTAVLARKKALISAGTDPLLAEKLAIDAEREQSRRGSKDKEIQQDLKNRTSNAKEAKK